MSLLEISNLTHTYGDTVLYKNAEFVLNKGEHVGVVGQNGAGKSTLIQICTGEVIPDTGRIVWQPNIKVGYLDQYAELENCRMIDFLKTAYRDYYEMEAKMNALYEQAGSGDAKLLERAARIQEELEQNDFYQIETRIDQVATGLGLTAIGLDHLIGEMSGGQRAKVILAKLLLENPEVLLLDEPTNFLDKEHVSWLAQYLSQIQKAFMVVSHDFGFLNQISDRICDIDNHEIRKYFGSYKEYTRKKALLREDYVRQYAAQQREIKKTEEFIRRNIAGRKTKMAQGRRKQLARMDKMEALDQKEIIPRFHFKEMPISTKKCLRIKELTIGYHFPLRSKLCFSVKGGEKVAITGFNGIGKSTLMKTLLGQVKPLGGEFHFTDLAHIGYYEQDLKWENPEQTPMQVVADAYPSYVEREVRKQLARCGISRLHAMQPLETLSGGEQAKVKMCLLVQKPCNFLILDEPTNHLDVQAKEALREALQQYSGTVMLVSHEEEFYRPLVSRVIRIE